ncbi:TetR/AcrR family transcriptional regulator [Bifidobacterium aquikefiri]|uniref:TetR/AcrR family transcriptional regulator n=1 Tax=Bifidobacterium aquikefiri TaxID=1653207 RepID=UPI0023EF7A26|nr:TetR family transcriptional regulator [Bifidobacterium aquikefiri]
MASNARGTYHKGEARRKQILDEALNIVAVEGFDQTTLSKISKAVGITEAGVLHYFDSIDDLLVQVLRERDAADLVASKFTEENLKDPETVRPENANNPVTHALGIIARNQKTPGLVELYAHMSVKAADSESCAYKYFKERGMIERALVGQAAITLYKSRHIPPIVPPEDVARLLQALLDGLQIQWLLENDLDMECLAQKALFAMLDLPTPPSAADPSAQAPSAQAPSAHTPPAHTPPAHTPPAHTPSVQTPSSDE